MSNDTTTLVTLFHAQNVIDSFMYRRDGSIYNQHNAMKACIEGQYKPVCAWKLPSNTVESEEKRDAVLENIFRVTQNIDEPWSKDRHRSTSVGDIVRIGDDKLYIVASCGFEALN